LTVALRRSRQIAWQMIGEEPVIMDLAGGRVLGLNPTGALVWSLLEERDEQGLAEAVAQRFEIDDRTAREDVRAFLALLRERGLVVEG
jgi:predicted DNA-binding transcriptional regulator